MRDLYRVGVPPRLAVIAESDKDVVLGVNGDIVRLPVKVGK